MRRRRDLVTGRVPERLLRFVPAEWPARSNDDAWQLWRTAQDMHAEQHGWPDGGLGLVRVRYAERLRLSGRTPPPWLHERPSRWVDADTMRRNRHGQR